MIACILLSRKLRENTTSILLLNLAIGDSMVCMVYQPLTILVMNDVLSVGMRLVVRWIGYCLQVVALNGMVCLTIDRFVFIRYPLRYATWMIMNRALIMVAVAWLVAFLLLIAIALRGFLAKSFIYIVVVFFFMLSLQLGIYVAARRQSRKIASQFAAVGIARNPRRRKANKAVAIVMIAFLFCWLPIMVTPSTKSPKAIVVSVWFISLNSLVNPILCCWQFKDIQKSLRKMLGLPQREVTDIEYRVKPPPRHEPESTGMENGLTGAILDTADLALRDL